MPAQYSKQTEKTGASIGTITTVWKPSTWNSGSDNWNIPNLYPGWLECNGATLNPNQYYALYQIIGNTYGGNVTGTYPNLSGTFKLPDFRGRVICGTGNVDGNTPNSPTLTPNLLPTGLVGSSDVNDAGATGGTYVLTRLRQLPPASEITEGGSDPGVYYDVRDTFLTSRQSFTGVALVPYGSGFTEVGGFSAPLITNGGQYLGFGTTGTSPFNSAQTFRQASYSNLNLSNYNQIIIYAIAGNDDNGGERVNDAGEGLRVIWPDNSETLILPSVGDTGIGISEWDPLYTTWVELVVEIPEAFRTTNQTIRFRQEWDGQNERSNPSGTETTHPNSNDCIGIQRIGFRLLNIDGQADDTFELGTFRTFGFGETTEQNVNATLGGNITVGIGPIRNSGIYGAPPHSHELQHSRTNSDTVASTADGGPEENDKSPILSDTTGRIIEYRRRLENSGASVTPTLRKHSHKLTFSNGTIITYGNDEGGGNAGAKIPGPGGYVTSGIPSDLDNTVSKTYSVVSDAGMEVLPGEITMNDGSRTLFDSRIDARFEAAEEIPVLQPYYRSKYIIKAY